MPHTTRIWISTALLLVQLLLWCAPAGAAEHRGADDFHRVLAERIRARVQLDDAERAWLAEKPLVNIRIGPVPPFHFMDAEPQGISVDYLKIICSAFALNCRFLHGIPWHEGLERFKRGDNVDLLPTIKRTPERDAYVLFSRDYLDAPWVIFTRSDNKFVGSVNDLHDHTVAVERAFVQHRLMEQHYPDIALLPAEDSAAAIKAVATGAADAYIGNLMTGTYLATQLGLSNIKVAAPTPFGNHNLAFGVRLALPELRSLLDKSLDAFTPQEISDIQNRWLSIEYEGVDWMAVKQYAAGAGLIVLAVLISFAHWGRKLQLQIKQRQATETALSQSQQQLAGIIETADEAIISVDQAQRIILFNDSAEQTFGYRRDEVLGEPLGMLLPAHLRERHDRQAKAFLAAGQTSHPRSTRGQLIGLRKDGREFPLEAGLSKQQLADQTVMTVVLRDVTAREQAEQEKDLLQRQLLQAQKMEAIGQLTGGIAHDFNNILAAIMGNTELAQHAANNIGNAQIGRYLNQIEASSVRARDLVAKMLAFSRGSPSQRQPLSLRDTVEEALGMMQSMLPSSIRIRFHSTPALPAVVADPVQINQVVTNLCINARDAMQNKGRLDVSLRQVVLDAQECHSCHALFSGAFVELAVSDSGDGIDAAAMDRIFDPFFTTKDVGQGTGMGLSMVHGIVHDHGGHILVQAPPDGGTRFRLLFPVSATRVTQRGDAPAEQADEPAPAHGDAHVLVVDDEAALLEYETELLQHSGYRVTGCQRSGEALALLEAGNRFDLLLTDQTMPELTGLELAQAARQLQPDLPVVLCTGHGSRLGGDGLHSGDIQAFVNKPFDGAQLTSLLAELLDAPG